MMDQTETLSKPRFLCPQWPTKLPHCLAKKIKAGEIRNARETVASSGALGTESGSAERHTKILEHGGRKGGTLGCREKAVEVVWFMGQPCPPLSNVEHPSVDGRVWISLSFQFWYVTTIPLPYHISGNGPNIISGVPLKF